MKIPYVKESPMPNFAPLMNKINSRVTQGGWGSQLLENYAELHGLTMAEAFHSRHGDKPHFKVPAKCIDMNSTEMTFQFDDGSTLSVSPTKVVH